MALFQKPPRTPEELVAAKPLALSPDQVQELDEDAWYAQAFRGEDSPQLTARALLMGSLLGFFLSLTNLYIGLKTGWHLGVAITACILSYSIWGFLQRLGLAKTPLTILENTCMASTASAAGYSTGGTLVSAFPALLLLSVTVDFPRGRHYAWWVLAAWTASVAALGVVMAIPMKRTLINQDRLRFPSGTAAAVTLQSLYSEGKEAAQKGRALLAAALVGGLLPLLKDLNVFKETTPTGAVVPAGLMPGATKIFDVLPMVTMGQRAWKMSELNVKVDNSLALVAAGAIVGLRVTTSMMVGALVLTFVLTPAALSAEWTNAAGKLVTAASKPSTAWKEIGLWLGAPILVSSGLLNFALQWRTIARAVTSLGQAGKGAEAGPRGSAEVPFPWFLGGIFAAGLPVVVLAWLFFGIPPLMGVLAVVLTFFLALVACRATGESDITPTGAMGKIVQLTYGVLLPQASTPNLMSAGITAGAASASADLLNDLKSGYLLGAHPRRQFVAQAVGIVSGTVASVAGFFVLVPDATALTGVDGRDPAFPAPGAQQWKAVADVFRLGIENLHPMARQCLVIGSVIGVVLVVLERVVPAPSKKLVPSATGFGLGFILPFYYPLAMWLGAVAAEAFDRVSKTAAGRYVVPIASGLIAGESIVGVAVAAINNFVLA